MKNLWKNEILIEIMKFRQKNEKFMEKRNFYQNIDLNFYRNFTRKFSPKI